MNDLDRFIKMLDKSYVPSRYLDGRDMEYGYWFRALLMDLNSILNFHNLPKSWPENFLKLNLFSIGWVGVFQSLNFGDPEMNHVAFNPCTFGGFDFYYQPEYIMVANPKFKIQDINRLYIGKNCELLQLNEDFIGNINSKAPNQSDCSNGAQLNVENFFFVSKEIIEVSFESKPP